MDATNWDDLHFALDRIDGKIERVRIRLYEQPDLEPVIDRALTAMNGWDKPIITGYARRLIAESDNRREIRENG